MNLKDLQNELDVQKWKLSEAENKDKCGEFAYCSKCDKSIEFPCAAAYTKANEKQEKAAPKKAAASRTAKKAK